jgi:hypothetical protein
MGLGLHSSQPSREKEQPMTPEERKLVEELFDRLATLEDVERDPDAERLIKDGLRQAPNAPYTLVQTVLVQDEALKRANSRIRELEGQGEEPARDTGFLGSMRESLFGTRGARGSVPSVRQGGQSPPSSGMSPAWRTSAPPTSASAAPAPAGSMPGYSAPPMGGSFLGTAASTAAGVIGGALLLDGIRSMMGWHPAAHAAFDPGTQAALDPSAGTPWTAPGGGELSREAGFDDIGRAGASDDARDNDYGLIDTSDSNDGDDDPDAFDIDDGGVDTDDGGVTDV